MDRLFIDQTDLTGKKVLVGATASIALYKAPELVRLLVKAGAKVRVVMSEEAKKFVTPLTFEAVSGHPVLHGDTECWSSDVNHIGYAQWADLFVVAPATANTVNKLSHGVADNLLLQTALACKAPKLLAPAANTAMLENPATQAALKMLRLSGYTVVDPVEGKLACGDVGSGAMAAPEELFWQAARLLLTDPFYAYRGIVVTGGGTVEKIDGVRAVTNFSSGKMAAALAAAAYVRGGDVCLITTRPLSGLPGGIHTIPVTDSREMGEYLEDAVRNAKKGVMTAPTLLGDSRPELVQKTPFLFAAAAVSDYLPRYPQKGKLKKEQIGETWTIEMKRNRDLLAELDKTGIHAIGFKAETDPATAWNSAKAMLEKKELEAVCLNVLGTEAVDFGTDTTAFTLLTDMGSEPLPAGSKTMVAGAILTAVKKLEAQ